MHAHIFLIKTHKTDLRQILERFPTDAETTKQGHKVWNDQSLALLKTLSRS